MDDPSALSHLVASTLRLKTDEKQALLEQSDVSARLRDVLRILKRELEVVELGTKIQSQVQSELEKGQREYFLRQQLKAIQDELGEGDEQQAELDELREQVEQKNLPEETKKAVERELATAREAAARRGRVRRHPHLPRLDPGAALERDHRGQPRPRARARRSSTRTTTTSRRSRSGSSSTSPSRS